MQIGDGRRRAISPWEMGTLRALRAVVGGPKRAPGSTAVPWLAWQGSDGEDWKTCSGSVKSGGRHNSLVNDLMDSGSQFSSSRIPAMSLTTAASVQL